MDRQIPGYFYDEEKKKYFKIQPNHTVPSGSTYSADEVKRRKLELETAFEIEKDIHRRKKLVRRAKILQKPLLGGFLSREQGHGLAPDGSALTFVEGWDSAEIMASEANSGFHIQAQRNGQHILNPRGHSRPMPEPHVSLPRNSTTVAIGAIEYDADTGSLFYPVNGGLLSMTVDRTQELREGHVSLPINLRDGAMPLATNSSPITSIVMDPKTRFVLTTWQAPMVAHNVHLVKLARQSVGFSQSSGRFSYYDDFGPSDLLGTSIQERVLYSNEGVTPTIWSATHGGPGSPFVFVMATGDAIITLDENADIYATIKQPSAVLAVETLSQAPAVALGGLRSGLIRYFDLRESMRQYFQDFETITHPSAVTHIRQSSEYLITVAGLNSTLCNYDLRFTKQQPRAKAWPHLQHAYKKVSNAEHNLVSDPVVVYPEHRNSAHVGLGFDIDVDAGIVAAAQYDSHKTISIFSIKTGALLRSLRVRDELNLGTWDDADVKALKFVEDRGHERMKSLWVGKGTRIVRYAW